MIKTCDNCRHGTICRLTFELWNYYGETLQGRVEDSPKCIKGLLDLLALHCSHWERYSEDKF